MLMRILSYKYDGNNSEKITNSYTVALQPVSICVSKPENINSIMYLQRDNIMGPKMPSNCTKRKL